MTPEVRIPDDVQALVGRANQNADLATRFHVTTTDEYTQADNLLRDLKQMEKTLDEKRKWLLNPAQELQKRINAFFKAPLDKIKDAKLACDRAMVGFRAEQQRRAQEEERRQREIIAREQARLEAEAAKERAEAEAKAAELRRRAEEAAAAGKAGQAAKLASQAEAKIEQGHSAAAALQTAAESMPAPQVAADIPKIAGSHARLSYECQVNDLNALIIAVAKGISDGTNYPPSVVLSANQTQLNRFATSLKEHFHFPGCELKTKESTVSRGR